MDSNFSSDTEREAHFNEWAKGYGDKPRSSKSRFSGATMSDLLAERMPDWLIPGILFEKQMGLIVAPPRSLKSFIALDMASSLAHAMPWNGHTLKKKAVIYVAGEGRANMRLRRMAWFKHRGIDPFDDNLIIVSPAVNLLEKTDVSEFIDFIAATYSHLDVGLIVIDTLARSMPGGNESASETMTLAIEHLQQIGEKLNCATLAVHHPGKDVSRGARGHSSLLGAVDVCLEVSRTGNGAEGNVSLRVVKQKDAEDGNEIVFDIKKIELGVIDGEDRSSLVVVPRVEPVGVTASKEAADRKVIARHLTEVGTKYTMQKIALLCGWSVGRSYDRIKQAVPESWIEVELDNRTVMIRRDFEERAGKKTNYVVMREIG